MCHLDISSNLTLFADDTTMIYSHKSISTCLKTLSSDLAVIEKWLKHNRLILNLKKTNAMLFSNGCRSNLIDDNIKLESNGINIPFVTSFKLLGVIVDNKLKFDLHTISICRKVCFKIHTLKSVHIYLISTLGSSYSSYSFNRHLITAQLCSFTSLTSLIVIV